MTAKRDEIIEEFFNGDDLGFVIGVFDGVLSGTMSTDEKVMAEQSDEYRSGYEYGKMRLILENPVLFGRIMVSGAILTFPEVVGREDLMRGWHGEDEDEDQS